MDIALLISGLSLGISFCVAISVFISKFSGLTVKMSNDHEAFLDINNNTHYDSTVSIDVYLVDEKTIRAWATPKDSLKKLILPYIEGRDPYKEEPSSRIASGDSHRYYLPEVQEMSKKNPYTMIVVRVVRTRLYVWFSQKYFVFRYTNHQKMVDDDTETPASDRERLFGPVDRWVKRYSFSRYFRSKNMGRY